MIFSSFNARGRNMHTATSFAICVFVLHPGVPEGIYLHDVTEHVDYRGQEYDLALEICKWGRSVTWY